MSPSSFAVLLAGAADALTFAVMGVAYEANPIVRAAPLLALAAKAGLALILAFWPWRYATQLRAIGAVAWAFGAFTNLAVLL